MVDRNLKTNHETKNKAIMIQVRLIGGRSSQEANVRNKGFVLSKNECLHQTLNLKTMVSSQWGKRVDTT